MAANLNGVRLVEAIALRVYEPAARERERLSRGQTVAVALSIALGVVVAGYGFVGSYLSISDLADRHDVPLAELVSAGIDGGLVAVVVLDLVLTWIRAPGRPLIFLPASSLRVSPPTVSAPLTLWESMAGPWFSQPLGAFGFIHSGQGVAVADSWGVEPAAVTARAGGNVIRAPLAAVLAV